jgi:hypothetical protein
MSYFSRSQAGMFASTRLGAHLIRGVIAFAALYWAVVHHQAQPVSAIAAGVVALIAFRGCPLCWSIGLAETVWERRRGRRRGD